MDLHQSRMSLASQIARSLSQSYLMAKLSMKIQHTGSLLFVLANGMKVALAELPAPSTHRHRTTRIRMNNENNRLVSIDSLEDMAPSPHEEGTYSYENPCLPPTFRI